MGTAATDDCPLLIPSSLLADQNTDLGQLAPPQDACGDGFPHAIPAEQSQQVVRLGHALAVKEDKCVADEQSAPLSGAASLDCAEQQSSLLAGLFGYGGRQSDGLRANTQVAAFDTSVGQERVGHPSDGRGGNGQGDASQHSRRV